MLTNAENLILLYLSAPQDKAFVFLEGTDLVRGIGGAVIVLRVVFILLRYSWAL